MKHAVQRTPLLLLTVGLVFSASANSRSVRPWVPERNLLNAWRFNSPEEWTNPRTRPLLSVNNLVTESWSGSALLMDGSQPALLALPAVAASGRPNLNTDSGMIRFWFAPRWASASAAGEGPKHEAALAQIAAWDAYQGTVAWSLAISSDGDQLTFSTIQAGQPVPLLEANIAWHADQWHQIAFAWSGSETILFVDAQIVAKTTGINLASPPVAGTFGFCLGSDAAGARFRTAAHLQ